MSVALAVVSTINFRIDPLQVRIWDLPKDELPENLLNAKWTLTESKRIESILWNPLAEGILAVSALKTVKVFDVSAQEEKFSEYSSSHVELSLTVLNVLFINTCTDNGSQLKPCTEYTERLLCLHELCHTFK